jgi:hypothetical protein
VRRDASAPWASAAPSRSAHAARVMLRDTAHPAAHTRTPTLACATTVSASGERAVVAVPAASASLRSTCRRNPFASRQITHPSRAPFAPTQACIIAGRPADVAGVLRNAQNMKVRRGSPAVYAPAGYSLKAVSFRLPVRRYRRKTDASKGCTTQSAVQLRAAWSPACPSPVCAAQRARRPRGATGPLLPPPGSHARAPTAPRPPPAPHHAPPAPPRPAG